MKKIYLIILLMLSILLVACEEITDEYNKEQEPSVELVSEGDLTQIYDENETLEDVLFTLKLNKFKENNIDENDLTINWYIGENHINNNDNKKTYTQIVKSPGEYAIKVVVKFKFDGIDKELEDNSLITVVREATKINVTNDVDETTHRISMKLGANNKVEFKALITGNIKISNLKWVIEKQVDGELILEYEQDVKEEDLLVTNKEAVTNFIYDFKDVGNYVIKLQTGERGSMDANVLVSNSTHLEINYGDFKIETEDQKIMHKDYDSRKLVVNELDESLAGPGVYKWYLNGTEINNENQRSYTHNNNDLGSYVYQVKFIPLVKSEVKEILTDPFLIVNGVLVSDEEELINALDEDLKGIIMGDDIDYNQKESIELKEGVAFYGDGYTIKSGGIDVFFKVIGNNVSVANVLIDVSDKYSVHVMDSKNVYFEDIKLKDFGATISTDDFISTKDFSAGIFIQRSEAIINNIEFLSEGLVGVRIDEGQNSNNVTRLTLYGEFLYNDKEGIILPIGSGTSSLENVELIATGFDYFALPAGNSTIRRWDNQGDPISWEIYDPYKTTYKPGESLDLEGVGIKVDISFILDMDIDPSQGLTFVKMYIDIFSQYGILKLTNMEDELLDTIYIVGELEKPLYGKDKLFYSKDKTLPNPNNDKELIPVNPKLPEEVGEYKLKIYIGEEFYLGDIIITIEE